MNTSLTIPSLPPEVGLLIRFRDGTRLEKHVDHLETAWKEIAAAKKASKRRRNPGPEIVSAGYYGATIYGDIYAWKHAKPSSSARAISTICAFSPFMRPNRNARQAS